MSRKWRQHARSNLQHTRSKCNLYPCVKICQSQRTWGRRHGQSKKSVSAQLPTIFDRQHFWGRRLGTSIHEVDVLFVHEDVQVGVQEADDGIVIRRKQSSQKSSCHTNLIFNTFEVIDLALVYRKQMSSLFMKTPSRRTRRGVGIAIRRNESPNRSCHTNVMFNTSQVTRQCRCPLCPRRRPSRRTRTHGHCHTTNSESPRSRYTNLTFNTSDVADLALAYTKKTSSLSVKTSKSALGRVAMRWTGTNWSNPCQR